MYDEENKASVVFVPNKKGKTFHAQSNLAIPDLDNTDTSLPRMKYCEFKKKKVKSFGNYFFMRKFTNSESPPHTNNVRARQETRNFNLEFGFSE